MLLLITVQNILQGTRILFSSRLQVRPPKRLHRYQNLSAKCQKSFLLPAAYVSIYTAQKCSGARRQHDDGDIRPFSQLPADDKAIQSRQHDIQENQVDILGPKDQQGFFATGCLKNLLHTTKIKPQHLTDLFIIFNQ